VRAGDLLANGQLVLPPLYSEPSLSLRGMPATLDTALQIRNGNKLTIRPGKENTYNTENNPQINVIVNYSFPPICRYFKYTALNYVTGG
jgi:hypothetical protein